MPYVHTSVDGGTLRGLDDTVVVSHLGVPYAADTAGPNRFRAPRPVEPWNGVRDALSFGPSAPQNNLRAGASGALGALLTRLMPRAGSPVEGAGMNEDCLHLNVWAPSGRHDDPLPVLVWLHGGGFTFGSGNEMSFHGDVLAAAGDLVVVTVTHRLGLLGFLDLRELGEPGSANAGMLDLVAALEWVQRNIRSFGGDPARVTLCGQSGGSGKVATLVGMPRARGLFARAIMMSGPFGRAHTASDAAALRARLTESAGFSSVDELRAAPLERLLQAQASALRNVAALGGGTSGRPAVLDATPGFGPAHDPEDLPLDPFGDAAADGIRDKQLLIGWTTHESTFLLAADPAFTTEMTREEAAHRIDAMAEPDGVSYADLVARFPDEPPHLLLGRRVSDLQFGGPSRRIADLAAAAAVGVWAYEFRQPTEALGGLLGATHSLDIPYVFGTVDRIPLTGRSLERHGVSRAMMRAWTSFVHQGDPGWEPWTRERTVHAFGTSYGPDLRLPREAVMNGRLERCTGGS
ncbi:carboxylesterase family protein [Pseudonocardia nematodicida]|uniref:Carboxylic ester hydrolase n=1 Tax=Pseudonocardia nematodicida TaxID=1206997 RepID=A0ABV1KDY1_9PSEU